MKSVRASLYVFAILLCSTVFYACEHRELTDSTNVHYLRVYLDDQIKNVNCGIYNEEYKRPSYNRPTALRAVLISQTTGKIVGESIIRNYASDSRGNYMDGYIAAPGADCHLLVYQMGSPTTLIRNYDDYKSITAYTENIDEYLQGYLPTISKNPEDDRIVLEPDHLMYTKCDDVSVEYTTSVDTLRNEAGDYFTAKSISKSYYLQMKIKGVEWVHAAAGALSGMAGSARIGYMDGIDETDPVNLFFRFEYADKQKRASDEASTAVLYATFTTFGKIPDSPSVLALDFEFTKKDGTTQVETIDLTEEFTTPMAIENQWILLDKEIVINAPSGTGGMAPGVEGWKDVEADIVM